VYDTPDEYSTRADLLKIARVVGLGSRNEASYLMNWAIKLTQTLRIARIRRNTQNPERLALIGYLEVLSPSRMLASVPLQ
jgi:hypothetical protein